MSDEEWACLEPFVIERGARSGRRPRDHRLVLDGVFWIARTGVAWRDLHEHFGKWSSVYRQFHRAPAGRGTQTEGGRADYRSSGAREMVGHLELSCTQLPRGSLRFSKVTIEGNGDHGGTTNERIFRP